MSQQSILAAYAPEASAVQQSDYLTTSTRRLAPQATGNV